MKRSLDRRKRPCRSSARCCTLVHRRTAATSLATSRAPVIRPRAPYHLDREVKSGIQTIEVVTGDSLVLEGALAEH